MRNSNLKRSLTHSASFSVAALLCAGMFSGCTDERLEGMPTWLGQSIYEELEANGHFTETLKLINAQDEDYASVLKKTGSKTVFVADDEAWAKFYQNNPWGVTSIEDMTLAQKKLLFKGNMINSAYLVELLGNIPSKTAESDPIEGNCMRRVSSVDIMDSVPRVTQDMFPSVNKSRVTTNEGAQIDYWSRVRGKESILLLQDDEVASMIHFMPKFMTVNNISDDDVTKLTNGEITSNKGAFVNGKVIKEKDITCQNGYVHVLDGVAMPLDNMANVIANDKDFSIYSRLLDRFSYPSFSQAMTDEYQRQYGGEDSVYVKRYFNSHGSHSFTARDNNDGGQTVGTQLPFDPGWNHYALYNQSGTTYQYDGAVMLVPTDEAMMNYLETDGADLAQRYKEGDGPTAWDNAPDEVVLPLLQNTMLGSMKAAIPSLFSGINNTAGEPMGVKDEDIEKTLWACNGLVYKTNKVYVAPEYVSVFYPCVIRGNEDLNLTYTVVTNDNKQRGAEGFYPYLNNMGSDYSFIIPTDNALQYYYDPVSRYRTNNKGASTAVAYQFYINSAGYIAANAPLVDWENLDAYGRGTITSTLHSVTPSTSTTSSGDVFNHFKDILWGSLSIGLFTPGQKFYTAKDGGPIVVEWTGDKVTGVAGSFQYERGYYIPVVESYDKSKEGNGRSYIVDQEPMMSTAVSPWAALNDSLNADKFGVFATLLNGMDIVATDDGSKHATQDKCLTNMNNFNYTVYVPTNESINALIDAHKLPTWDDIDAIENCITGAELDSLDEAYLIEQKQIMADVITNFVTYHMQDNSVYVEGAEHNNDVFETACLDTTTTRFAKLYVNYSLGGKMTITDNCGNVRTVDSDCNNILTRQYYFNGSKLNDNSCTSVYSSSFAVLHQIDAPLVPFKELQKGEEMGKRPLPYYDPAAYEKVMKIVEENPANGTSKSIKRRTR